MKDDATRRRIVLAARSLENRAKDGTDEEVVEALETLMMAAEAHFSVKKNRVRKEYLPTESTISVKKF